MHQRRLRAAVSSAVVVLCPAALAGAASAATVVTVPCVATVLGHVDRTVPIKGAGFTPGGFVTIGYTSATDPPVAATTVRADPAGGFVTTAFPAAFTNFNTQHQTFGLLAVDQTKRITAVSTFQQVRLGFTADPEPKRPTSKITYTARGFPVGKAVYAHFRFGDKTRRSVKVGTTSAPCGIVSRRMRALPTKIRFGTWKVYVDQSPTYSPRTKPQVMNSFVIYRRFR